MILTRGRMTVQLGLALRDAALDAFESTDADTLAALREEARRVCARTGRVSANDLRHLVELVEGQPHSRNLIGATFRGHEWRVVDWTRSTEPAAHGRRILVYERAA